MKFSAEYLYFILARLAGLSTKPFFLLYMMKYASSNDVTILSIIYLLFGGIFVLYHIPVHFEYYKAYFEKEKTFLESRRIFFRYLENLTIHISLILPIVFIVILLLTDKLFISIILIIYLLLEKIFDEIQRFLQFKKDFISWSNIFLFKTLLPVVFTIVIMEFSNSNSIYLYIILNMVAIIIIAQYSIPRFVLSNLLYKIIFKMNYKKLKNYVLILKEKYISKYILGISTANILNIDKWLATLLYTKLFLTELTLISQYSNAITVGMNYITIANRRSDLLKSNNDISSLLHGIKVPIIAFVLFVIMVCILYFIDSLTNSIKELSFSMIIFVLLSYTVYSISAPLTEFLFWNGSIKTVLLVDGAFFTVSILFGIFLYYTHNYIQLPLYILIGHILRTLSHLYIVTIKVGT